MADRPTLLPPRSYVDPAAFELEASLVLGRGWLPVCRADQVPSPGDRLALTLLGRPLVCVRNTDHEVRVFGNVCAHRGSTIAPDGPGHDGVLVCPYHRWAYRLDGSFVGAPLADGADLDGVCLTTVRHTVWEGFVLVDLSGTAPDPSADLAGLAAAIAPWRWSELVTIASQPFDSQWNWKIMVENWIECYHHLGTHRDTVEPVQPARTTTLVPGDGGPWVAMTVESVEEVVGEPEVWLPGVDVSSSRLLSVWSAFPLLLGGSMSRYAFWLHVVPVDVGRHTVTWHLLTHPDRLDLYPPEEAEQVMAMLATVHEEDMRTCAAVQAGLASGFIDRVRLTALEAPIADLHRWIGARLTSA